MVYVFCPNIDLNIEKTFVDGSPPTLTRKANSGLISLALSKTFGGTYGCRCKVYGKKGD